MSLIASKSRKSRHFIVLSLFITGITVAGAEQAFSQPDPIGQAQEDTLTSERVPGTLEIQQGKPGDPRFFRQDSTTLEPRGVTDPGIPSNR